MDYSFQVSVYLPGELFNEELLKSDGFKLMPINNLGVIYCVKDYKINNKEVKINFGFLNNSKSYLLRPFMRASQLVITNDLGNEMISDYGLNNKIVLIKDSSRLMEIIKEELSEYIK